MLQNSGVRFIAKQMSPLAVVFLSPIEDYSGALKKATHDARDKAKSFDKVRERIKRKASKIPTITIAKLF